MKNLDVRETGGDYLRSLVIGYLLKCLAGRQFRLVLISVALQAEQTSRQGADVVVMQDVDRIQEFVRDDLVQSYEHEFLYQTGASLQVSAVLHRQLIGQFDAWDVHRARLVEKELVHLIERLENELLDFILLGIGQFDQRLVEILLLLTRIAQAFRCDQNVSTNNKQCSCCTSLLRHLPSHVERAVIEKIQTDLVRSLQDTH